MDSVASLEDPYQCFIAHTTVRVVQQALPGGKQKPEPELVRSRVTPSIRVRVCFKDWVILLCQILNQDLLAHKYIHSLCIINAKNPGYSNSISY